MAMIHDLGLVRDTEWFATCLSGNPCLPPGAGIQKTEQSNEFVKIAHAGTPGKRVIKEYLIMKTADLPGAASSSKGRRTKTSTLVDALDHAEIRVLKQLDAGCFEKLLMGRPLLQRSMDAEGGAAVFGTFADWGCPFNLLHIQEKWGSEAFELERRLMEQHSSTSTSMASPVSRTVVSLAETVDMTSLQTYILYTRHRPSSRHVAATHEPT